MKWFSKRLYTIYRMLVEKKARCKISIRSSIEENVILEGDNYVGKNTILKNCSVGRMSYLGDDCVFVNATVGRYTSIASGFKIYAGLHPTKEFVSTHPAFYSASRPQGRCYVKQKKFEEHRYIDDKKKLAVAIGNDVWIASDVAVFEGVSIANGAIVAAGALVTHDIPAYAIAMGRPAKVVGYRFNSDEIDWLLKTNWWDKKQEQIEKKADLFENIELFRNGF